MIRIMATLCALAASGVVSANAAPTYRPVISQRQMDQIVDIIYADQPEQIALGVQINLGNPVPGLTPMTPLPAQVIGMVPSFVNHAYFVLNDGRVVIVEPTNLEIVAIFG